MQSVYMTAKCKEILELLLQSDDYLTKQQIAEAMRVTKRSIYYDICRIDEWLSSNGLPELGFIRGKGILLDEDMREKIRAAASESNNDTAYVMSPMERVHAIICAVAYIEEPLYIEQLIEICKVSRNTIFNDLRIVSRHLSDYNISLLYEAKSGYTLSGDPIKCRAVFLLSLQAVHTLIFNGLLDFIDRERVRRSTELLVMIEKELNTKYVDGLLDSLSVMLPLMERGDTELNFPSLKRKELEKTREFRLVEKYFPQLVKSEQIYLCLHLLGARVAVASNDIFDTHSNQMVYELTKALIAEFERTACVVFEDRDELERSLFTHISSSLYRYQYGIQIVNSMSNDIIREYGDLFEITKIVSRYLEQQIGLPVQDEEIAYLAMHFGAHLSISRYRFVPRIAVVCSNGIATGNMLKRELQNMLGDSAEIKVLSADGLEEVPRDCDFIVSTVSIKSELPVIYVHPIMTAADKEAVMRKVKHKPLAFDIEGLFEVVSPYLQEKDHAEVRQKISDFLLRNTRMQDGWLMRRVGLLDMLPEEHIAIHEGHYGWTEALRLSGRELVENGLVEERYLGSIISQLNYYGPYMFIFPRIILAHAKPEDGVRHLGLSMHIFCDSVKFSDFYKADIIIVLAAADQESHLKILKDILQVFSIETRIDALTRMNSAREVRHYLSKVLEEASAEE